MFICRYALFRIIIAITVIVIIIIIIIVLPPRKKRLLLLASTAAITIVPLVLILVIIHRSHCTYCAVIIPFYHRIVYLEIYLYCNNNTNRGVNKITDMEKAHRLKFWVLLQQAFTCKTMSYY